MVHPSHVESSGVHFRAFRILSVIIKTCKSLHCTFYKIAYWGKARGSCPPPGSKYISIAGNIFISVGPGRKSCKFELLV